MTFGSEPGSGLSRQSIVTASADETAQSDGSVERSGIERGRRRRDVAPDLHFHFSFAPDVGRSDPHRSHPKSGRNILLARKNCALNITTYAISEHYNVFALRAL